MLRLFLPTSFVACLPSFLVNFSSTLVEISLKPLYFPAGYLVNYSETWLYRLYLLFTFFRIKVDAAQ